MVGKSASAPPISTCVLCNPGDPVPATLRGTVFYTQRFDPHQHRAVLLLHGGTLDRRFWDGFKIPGALRFAAELARQSDTAVFTVDRLGYGESPYDRGPGSGFKVTPDTYVETTHEIDRADSRGFL